jgi:L-alanine-DL-glutamate epimerase-like enolase superfamily enzyme
MLTEPITVDKDGYITIPSRPGLGVEVDWEKVRAHGEKVL